MQFYSVAKGKIPGIYNTWNKAKEQINGYSGAVFKKFNTMNEAKNFIEINNIKEDKIIELTDSYDVYTDGSSINYIGGYGFVVLKNNIIQSLHKGRVPYKKSTNNIAELYAIFKAIETLKDNMVIYTDSLYAMNVITKVWNNNTNYELINEIQNMIKGKNIKFNHIKGHSGNKYNELADKLANEGREEDCNLLIDNE